MLASCLVAITVASSDCHDNRQITSNYGKCVNLFAPGHPVLSLDARHRSAFVEISGTSMAAPAVAGIAAAILSRSPVALLEVWSSRATDSV